jgi:hypothetical protein
MVATSSSDGKLKIAFAYLVVSAASVRGIPFLKPWGVDLQNLHAYEICSEGKTPYLIPGHACGDVFGRDMVYPPVLFHSFAWLRGMKLESAMYVWTAATLLLLGVAFYAWARPLTREAANDRPWEIVIFCSLLTLQFPLVFLLERGGTDVVPLFLWTAASYLFCRGKIALSGIACGIAAAFKLYPAIPCVVVTWALLVGGWRGSRWKKSDFLRFGGGALASFIVLNLFFLRDARFYFTTTLPKFSAELTQMTAYSHALPSFAGADHALYFKLPLILLLILWCWSAGRSLPEQPAMTFAGALAVSTFFSATSWDYNLVTTFPLILMFFLRARRSGKWSMLAFGLVAIVGDRELFTTGLLGLFNPFTHLALEFAWLVVAAIEIAHLPPADSPRVRSETDSSHTSPTTVGGAA